MSVDSIGHGRGAGVTLAAAGGVSLKNKRSDKMNENTAGLRVAERAQHAGMLTTDCRCIAPTHLSISARASIFALARCLSAEEPNGLELRDLQARLG